MEVQNILLTSFAVHKSLTRCVYIDVILANTKRWIVRDQKCAIDSDSDK